VTVPQPQEATNLKTGMTLCRDAGKRLQFAGIVIWRIANRQLHERWTHLEPPRVA